MGIASGRLRHRVDFERRQQVQDPESGAITVIWEKVYEDIPAAVEALSTREFIAAQAVQSEVTKRIVVRRLPGLNAAMRIVHGDDIYNPHGFLEDRDSGMEYFTIPVSAGVNDG
ncbi:phage head closure protein [Pandoraea norimbergensis]